MGSVHRISAEVSSCRSRMNWPNPQQSRHCRMLHGKSVAEYAAHKHQDTSRWWMEEARGGRRTAVRVEKAGGKTKTSMRKRKRCGKTQKGETVDTVIIPSSAVSTRQRLSRKGLCQSPAMEPFFLIFCF